MVNLSGIVDTEALSFEAVAFEKGLSLEVKAIPDIKVLGDEQRLRQLVAILVDNATKYAKVSSTIKVEVSKQQASATLCVFNECKAISPEQQQHLFERFYRGDTSRSTKGSGLGLSIAQAIVDEHKGKITVHSDASGTRFTVSIPA
jgi:signal transduction histidine kinase